MPPEDALGRARERYIELLKRSLLGELYYDNELRIRYLLQCVQRRAEFSPETLHDIRRHEPEEAARRIAADAIGMPLDLKLENLGFPHTMLGRKRLDHLEWCVRTVIAEKVPGDFIECGIWRGGAVVLIRALLEILEEPGRFVWAADSFQGIPPPTHPEDVAFGLDLSRERFPMLAIPRATVERTLADYGFSDDRVRFLEGWFKDTLPSAPITRLSILRLDGDIYESTADALGALYDKLVPGGFLIIDDHFVPTCKKAVEDFRRIRGITEPIVPIDWTGVYWRKER
ncbi:MAG TPA: TylF/MycF/NovP-related O-methyltransferase [Polyangiaceae bacterium]|nr:TylF/MycF/NovP-related O-methyltransferase [Polyangiaceae bacterium]